MSKVDQSANLRLKWALSALIRQTMVLSDLFGMGVLENGEAWHRNKLDKVRNFTFYLPQQFVLKILLGYAEGEDSMKTKENSKFFTNHIGQRTTIVFDNSCFFLFLLYFLWKPST